MKRVCVCVMVFLLVVVMLAGCGPGGQAAEGVSMASSPDSMAAAAPSSEAVQTSSTPERARTVTKLYDLVPEDLYDITLTHPEDPETTYTITAEQQFVLAGDFEWCIPGHKERYTTDLPEELAGWLYDDPWPGDLPYPEEIDPHDLHFTNKGMEWHSKEVPAPFNIPIGFTYDTGGYRFIVAIMYSLDTTREPDNDTYWRIANAKIIPLETSASTPTSSTFPT